MSVSTNQPVCLARAPAQDLAAAQAQAAIWHNASTNVSEKASSEVGLLRQQLDARGTELAELRGHAAELEAARDEAVRGRRRAQDERAQALAERVRAAAMAAEVRLCVGGVKAPCRPTPLRK